MFFEKTDETFKRLPKKKIELKTEKALKPAKKELKDEIEIQKSIEIGVIGAGYWGKKHVEEYLNLGLKITVADLKDENLNIFKEKSNISVTKNYKDIIQNKDISAVSICTPNETHYKICKECLEAGKNVLVEKPLAMSVAQGEKLIELAKQKNLVLVVGHIFRFNNAIRKIKEMINNKEFGEIFIVKLKWVNLEPTYEDRDVIYDLAPHSFDIINYLFDRDPDEVSCVGNAFRRKMGPEAVFINCRLDRIIINIELNWLTPRKERSLTIIGSKKTAFVDCLSQKIDIVDNNQIINFNVIKNNTIQDELKNFIDCIKNKQVSIANAEIGIKTIKMIEMVEMSLIQQKTMVF